MKASELIKFLKKSIETHGDLPVVFANACFKYGLSKEDINAIKFKEKDRWRKEPYLELDNR